MTENNIDWIQSVKVQGEGYLVNGSLSVPNSLENRHMKDVQAWLDLGNTPEPEFTAEELAKQELDKQIAEAQAYLDSTDFKMTADYDQDTTEVRILRQEARDFIRANEGDN